MAIAPAPRTPHHIPKIFCPGSGGFYFAETLYCVTIFLCAKATKSTEGFVYFIHAPEVDRIKIGFSIKLDTRVNELRMGSPTELVLLKYLRGTLQLEIAVLALFDKYRLHGEWFTATDELKQFIAKLPNAASISPEELIKNF